MLRVIGKLKNLLLALVLLFTVTTPALAAQVFVNGEQLNVSTVNESGITLIPLRAIFQSLNAIVNWDEVSQTVTATKAQTTVKLQIGSSTAYINGQAVTLQVPGKIIKGNTMVPLRFVSEALDANVKWDGVAQTITITSVSETPIEQATTEKIDNINTQHNNATEWKPIWEKILDRTNIHRVWFWKDKQFAIVRGEERLYFKEPDNRDWSSKVYADNIYLSAQNAHFYIYGVALTPEKMYMSIFYENENKLLVSNDGIKWVSDGLNPPSDYYRYWITAPKNKTLLANSRGLLKQSLNGGNSWNYDITSRCAPWDNVTFMGDKIFAVLDNKLKTSNDLEDWQDTGFEISDANICKYYIGNIFSEESIIGKAVPSIDYPKDNTVVAFNPASTGSVCISPDGGNNWLTLKKDSFKWREGTVPSRITSVAVSNYLILAGTFDGVVFYSVNKGQTWQKTKINADVLDLAIKDNIALAATNKGVYQMDCTNLVHSLSSQ